MREIGKAQVASNFLYRLFAALLIGWIPVLFDSGAIQLAAELYPLANSAQPDFVPSHALLLYLRAPLAALSGVLLCLSPGLIVALARPSSSDASRWIVSAFGVSLVLVSVVTSTVQTLVGEPLRDAWFKGLLVVLSLLAAGFTRWRQRDRRSVPQPLRSEHSAATLLLMALVPWLLLVTLAPKFYWENFNPDGNEAFETGRLLLWQPLPFWSADAGLMAHFPGVTSMLFTFPASWFIRLFGEFEVAARLPVLLYLIVLFAAIVSLANHGRSQALRAPERLLIWLGLSIYLVVMAYSATYNPYSADIAEPATHDTLLMVCFLGFVLEFVSGNKLCMALWLGLAYLSWPITTVLTGLWLLAVVLLWRPRPWNLAGTSCGVLLACILAGRLIPMALEAAGQPAPGGEYSWMGLVESIFTVYQIGAWLRLSFLWQEVYLDRWAFLIFPAGILPAISLLAWRWQDRVTKAVTLTAIGYFAFFYIQAFVSLHYFVPAMILPLVVYWRMDWPERRRWLILSATAAAGLLALYLSIPENTKPMTEARVIGEAIEDRFGGYDTMDQSVFRRHEVLLHLIPSGWEPGVPEERFGGLPNAWTHYVFRKGSGKTTTNYVLQPASDDAPEGAELLHVQDGVALYVFDKSVMARHRRLKPPLPVGSFLYRIRRDLLLQKIQPLEETIQFILKRLGLEPETR